MEPQEVHISLALGSGQVNPAGSFEVIAITAGEGNGWQFSEDVLKDSLALWDGAECFADHGGYWGGRSVRDLGGIFRNPRWSPDRKGVQLDLQTLGPSSQLVEELGRQILAEKGPKPNVGFSADVLFTARGRQVQKILRVNSLDLVIHPARGGAFVRALNSVQPNFGEHMEPITESTPTQQPAAAQQQQQPPQLQQLQLPQMPAGSAGGIVQQLSADAQAMRDLLQVQHERQALAAEAEEARKVRAQMCEYLLESGLSASRLPAAMQAHVRQQFAGQIFDAAQLNAAIEDARKLVSELTGAAAVAGPGRLHGMFSTEDQLQAAVDDLLDAPRDPAAASLKVSRLSGIRELYHLTTGDYDMHGGYHADRVTLATTSDFTGLVKNALNKIVVNQWDKLGRAGYNWWERIAVTEHFGTLQDITGTLVGTVGTLPSVAEGGDYTELAVGDSPEVASFTKYGGYIPLTLELIDRDETRKLKAYPRELAAAGLRKISELVAAIFTAESGVGPTLADTGALFNATAVTTAGGHANLTTAALAAAQWDTVCTAVYNQPMLTKAAGATLGVGPKMAVNPRFILVPRALQLTGMKILYPTLENAANIYSENQQRGQPGDVITVPEWTDSDNWAAACDPTIAPAIFVGERFGILPEIFIAGNELSPAVFTNDEHRLKVRHFLAVWVNDFRPLHKANVAAG